MQSAAPWLYAAGALPPLALGAIHALYTWRDRINPRMFAPASRELLQDLRAASPRVSGATTLWRAGLGFHFSHSLGMLMVGALYLWLGLAQPLLLIGQPPLLWAAPLIAAAYALLAWRYWFAIPLTGCLLSGALFAAGLLLTF